jgi:REP element-mobilizing transposase RayT
MTQARGWHSRGYLPHFDSPETIQFVTFRLADSLPRAVIEALNFQVDAVQRIDHELDGGLGACWLRRPEIASLVQDALLHFDGERYRLLAWCLMPNHVHVVIEIQGSHSLSDIVRSWKSFTSRRANVQLGRSGPFWQADYFDRYIRDEEHLARTIEYVEQNPVKAGLASAVDDWTWSSGYQRGREGAMSGPGGPRSA